MVTKYASISQRQMPLALRVLTREKTMVAMSDYGDEHRMLKKMVMTNLLGPNIQVRTPHIVSSQQFLQISIAKA